MAVPSWTPGTVIHVNDGTAEYDAAYINQDAFGSQYRSYQGDNSIVDMYVRHQKLATKVGFLGNDRHNLSWIYDKPGATLSDPLSHYAASFSFESPRNASATVSSQFMNAAIALLAVSAVRSQLLTWRV